MVSICMGPDPNADSGIFSRTWATMRSVTRLIVGTPSVTNEGGYELTACEFRCPEVGVEVGFRELTAQLGCAR
ncbi:hypothetical protein U1Q18_031690, partial [Sarracenia purpurea var. burkii]